MPPKAFDFIDNTVKFFHIWNAAQMAHKIKSTATAATFIELFDISFGKVIIDVGNPSIGTATLGYGIKDGIIIGPVTTGIHQNCAGYLARR